jgi:hypothetical protein
MQMLNGALIGMGIGFASLIYNATFVVEFPPSVELIAHFLLHLVPWAIVGGATGWFVGKRKSAPPEDSH